MSSSSSSVAVGEAIRAAAQRLTTAGSDSGRLDAELLLGHLLRVGRTTLLAQPEVGLAPSQVAAFDALVERRAQGEPVAYIRGLKEFYGLVLSVDARALIPRPETETLVSLAVAHIGRRLVSAPRPPGGPQFLVWDVGTGSGAIVVAVAVECRRRGYASDVRFIASDISAAALEVATENAVAHGVADAIRFAQADLTDLPDPDLEPADLLLANLPYIPSAVVPELPVAASFEPREALDGGPDGLDLVRRLLERLPRALAPDGAALLEIGSDQHAEVVSLAPMGWTVTIHDDLAGRPRVAELARGAR